MKAMLRDGVPRVAFVLSLLGAVLMLLAFNKAVQADTVDSRQAPIDEKLAAAKDWYRASTVAFDAGTIRISDLYEAAIAWKEASFEAATTKQGRIKALEAHLDRMAKLAKKVSDLEIWSTVDHRGKETMCRFWVLEAKIWVAEEKRKP